MGATGGSATDVAWTLEAPTSRPEHSELRRRRAVLLLLLSIPGRSIFSPQQELSLHERSGDVDGASALLAMLSATRLRTVDRRGPASTLLQVDGSGSTVVLKLHMSRPDWPSLVVANFSKLQAWTIAGEVMLRSDEASAVGRSRTARTLPPMTSCWVSPGG